MCVWGRGWLSPRYTPSGWGVLAGFTAAPVSACITVQIQSSREVSSHYRWARKAENPGGTPRRHELHMTSTWLHLEPICTQMKNKLVTSVRSSGTHRVSESREQPESQAHLSPASCPVSAPSALCSYSRSISVGCAPHAPTQLGPTPQASGHSVLCL